MARARARLPRAPRRGYLATIPSSALEAALALMDNQKSTWTHLARDSAAGRGLWLPRTNLPLEAFSLLSHAKPRASGPHSAHTHPALHAGLIPSRRHPQPNAVTRVRSLLRAHTPPDRLRLQKGHTAGRGCLASLHPAKLWRCTRLTMGSRTPARGRMTCTRTVRQADPHPPTHSPLPSLHPPSSGISGGWAGNAGGRDPDVQRDLEHSKPHHACECAGLQAAG
ncbi:hypothetical protein BC628DRAFT_710632 [Trametes gibbosa]|nr:hypothetical protein BC628DRAFT_710632 [Trametes gibbosa]